MTISTPVLPQLLTAINQCVSNRYDQCVGYMLCGSAATGNYNEGSDVDLLIFYEDIYSDYKEVFTYREYQIEALIYPIHLFKDAVVAEGKERKNILKELGTKSLILQDTDNRLSNLKSEISQLYAAGPLPLSDSEAEQLRYVITNRLDDFKVSTDFTEACFILHELLQHLLDLVLLRANRWSFKGSMKWMLRSFDHYDPQSAEVLRHALTGFYQNQSREGLVNFIINLLEPLGGILKEGYTRGLPPQYNKPQTWLCVDIYYPQPHRLLCDLILPLCLNLKQSGQIHHWFYSFHFEGESFVRIHFTTHTDKQEENIAYLSRCIEQFRKQNPTDEPPANRIVHHIENLTTALYGGVEGMECMEEFQECTSRFILHCFKCHERFESKALVYAIRLSVVLSRTLQLSARELALFTDIMMDQVLPLLGSGTVTKSKTAWLHKMQDRYDRASETINHIIQTVAEGFPYSDVNMELEHGYYEIVKKYYEEVKELHMSDRFFVPPIDPAADSRLVEHGRFRYLQFNQILNSLCNQLGLSYADECYLIFILMKCSPINSSNPINNEL